MQRAYGYIRVSSKGQVDGDGFERQESEIRTYAQSAGYEIQGLYREEGVSGTTGEADRPAFQAMVEAILRNGVRTVIVEGLDRLAREYRIQETLLVYLAAKGIALIVARTGENVTEAVMADPMRRALVQIQGVFAELEKGMLVLKLRAARERKRAREGKCEGRKGYLDTEEGREIIREVKRLRRRKPGCKAMSYEQISKELNRKGFRTITGCSFAASTVQQIHKSGQKAHVKKLS